MTFLPEPDEGLAGEVDKKSLETELARKAQELAAEPLPPSPETLPEDEPICPDGPAISLVHQWKKQFEQQGHGVYLDFLAGKPFVWRTLSRLEFKEIASAPSSTELTREEMIAERVVLWPQNFSTDVVGDMPAGIPSAIAEHCLVASGFDKAAVPVRL